MFCPKCGAILMPKQDGNRKLLACKCGYTDKDIKKAKLKEVMDPSADITVVDRDMETKTLPLTEAKCPACGHRKAYFWTLQTRAMDEPETKFLKCEKCSKTWRDYS